MMTQAPIHGLIGRLSVPTIISMLITSFYNMADTFFVGKLSTSATAAIVRFIGFSPLFSVFSFPRLNCISTDSTVSSYHAAPPLSMNIP